MPDIHCGKRTKLSNTIGVSLDTMGEVISSKCPSYRETGSNYLFTPRDFKKCMVIRAIYFTMHAFAIK